MILSRMKKIFKMTNLKYLIVFLVPLVFVMIMTNQLDSDSWYVLAEGKEISENGIYYTDQLSMHEGLNVTVQNYGFAVIFYWIFSIFGASGIYIIMLILNMLVCFLLYKICMTISNKNVNLSLIIALATDVVLALLFVVTRAQMVSYVLFLGLIYVLELYTKTDKKKYLWWLPVLSLLQVNLHASLWPMLIVVTLIYIIDGINAPRLHLQGYKIKPIIIMGVLMLVAGLINPYGIKMMFLMLSSYGDSRFMELVSELHPFDLRNLSNVLLYGAIVVTIVLQIFGNKRGVKMRYILMSFGFLALGLNSVKGMSQYILVMFLPLVAMYSNVDLSRVIEAKKIRNVFLLWTGIIATCCFFAVFVLAMSRIKNYPDDEALILAVDSMDASLEEGVDKKSLKVYSGYNYGGYAELRGYRTYLDARGEVFLKANNGKEDILYEWIDFSNGKIDKKEFLDKYGFDYLLVEGEDDPFYSLTDDKYTEIFSDSEACVKLYKRVLNG